jgi:hypothetical protein
MKFEEFMQSAFGADWKDGTYDILDMKAAFEVGCHSDIHTDNSKVIESLSQQAVQLQYDNSSQRDVIYQQYEQIQQMKLDVKKLFDKWDKENE